MKNRMKKIKFVNSKIICRMLVGSKIFRKNLQRWGKMIFFCSPSKRYTFSNKVFLKLLKKFIYFWMPGFDLSDNIWPILFYNYNKNI